MSFLTISKSEILRNNYELANGVQLPSSPNTVRQSILKYASEVRDTMKKEIRDLRAKGVFLGLTLDEWTSLGNRRYMNINVYGSGKFFNLGLARIRGSCTAEAALELLKAKLADFDLNLDSNDVFALTTDGAATMQKLGRISGKKQQLCLAHGVHLAVTDVLYKKPAAPIEVEVESGDEEGDDDDEGECGLQFETENKDHYRDDIRGLISRVRKVVKLFRNSALKLEVLNKYSGSEEAKSLILDCKTRWNSLVDMLDRFLLMRYAVKKALIDLDEPETVTDEDYDVIAKIVAALRPVKVAAESFCRSDASLIIADVAISFMLNKLASENSEIAREIFSALKTRLNERRTVLSDVLSYLHFQKEDKAKALHELGGFPNTTRQNLTSLIKEIYEICKPTPTSSSVELDTDVDDVDDSMSFDMSLEVELSLAITKAQSFKAAQANGKKDHVSSLSNIKREMLTFEATGVRGKVLSTVYEALISIPPSSVESERVFSSATNFNTKLRSKLGDESVDALVFLKSFLKKN